MKGREQQIAESLKGRRQFDARVPWVERAACDPHNAGEALSHLFFPPGGHLDSPEAAAAMRICARCPVKTDCERWAVEVEKPVWGVYGGRDFGTERADARLSGSEAATKRRLAMRARRRTQQEVVM